MREDFLIFLKSNSDGGIKDVPALGPFSAVTLLNDLTTENENETRTSVLAAKLTQVSLSGGSNLESINVDFSSRQTQCHYTS